MRGLISTLFAACLIAGLPDAEAQTAKRIALVIGNSAYRHVDALPNPVNDASAVATVLRAAGFSVANHQDLAVADLRRALGEFADAARGAEMAVVFFAGHGIEVDGVNYLIPVDARLARDFDIEDESISLDRVLKAIEPATQLRLVMLDACRDNPFAKRMKRTMSTRSIGRGLAKVEPTVTDMLVAFAAEAGSVAADGDGRNSPFTTAIVNHITSPGLDLRIAFGRVRDEVMSATGNRQRPFVYGSLGGRTVAIVERPAAIAPPSAAPTEASASEAERVWSSIKDSSSPAMLEAFVARFGGSIYARFAEARLGELRRLAARTDIVTPPSPAAPVVMPQQQPAVAGFAPRRKDFDLGGQYYAVFDLPKARPELCEARCGNDARCLGYTYTTPGKYNYPRPRCWLKSSVTGFSGNPGVISAVRAGVNVP